MPKNLTPHAILAANTKNKNLTSFNSESSLLLTLNMQIIVDQTIEIL